MNHEINLPAAAAGARKARVPVDDGGLGTVALGHFAGVGLDLAAAVSTPYDQPQPSLAAASTAVSGGPR